MKLLIKIFVLHVFLVFGFSANAQDECKVLLREIADHYAGKCKKGLAHGSGKATGQDTYEGSFRKGLPDGQGSYTWADGTKFEGRWVSGERDGFGVLTFKIGVRDSVVRGMWKGAEYLGPKPEKPKVISALNVDRHSFRRLGDGSQLAVNIYMNGVRNTDIENLSLISNSGSEYHTGHQLGYEHIVFPVHGKISYSTWNKAHTTRYRVFFEFEITQAGNWELNLHN